jgi:hypothetical protein
LGRGRHTPGNVVFLEGNRHPRGSDRRWLMTRLFTRPRIAGFPASFPRGRFLRVVPTLVAVLALAALAALTACGGDDEPAATTPVDEIPTQAPTVEQPTPTPEGVTPDASSPTGAATLPEINSLCDLVTPDDVEEALDDPVTDGTESTRTLSCGYTLASGGSVNLNLGSQEDFETGVFRTGDLGEPVPGVGDQAAWWFQADVGAGVAGDQGILSVRQGEFYFQVKLFLSGPDEPAQLEIAKDLAAKAVERLP